MISSNLSNDPAVIRGNLTIRNVRASGAWPSQFSQFVTATGVGEQVLIENVAVSDVDEGADGDISDIFYLEEIGANVTVRNVTVERVLGLDKVLDIESLYRNEQRTDQQFVLEHLALTDSRCDAFIEVDGPVRVEHLTAKNVVYETWDAFVSLNTDK